MKEIISKQQNMGEKENENKKLSKERFFEIQNNNFYEVRKLRTDTGITSLGYDLEGVKIGVTNIDAGQSKALMKIAIEGERRFGGLGLKFVVIATLGTILFFIVIFIGYKKFSPKPSEVPVLITSQTINTPAPIENNIMPIGVSTGSTDTEKERESIDIERISMRSEFEKESLMLELKKRDLSLEEKNKENIELSKKIVQLEGEIKIKDESIFSMQEKIKTYESRDTSKDAFFQELGKKVDEKCRENGSSTCKDMYYNFIQ